MVLVCDVLMKRHADEAPGLRLDSDHDSPMVAKSVMVARHSGAQYRPSSGATSDSDIAGTAVGVM